LLSPGGGRGAAGSRRAGRLRGGLLPVSAAAKVGTALLPDFEPPVMDQAAISNEGARPSQTFGEGYATGRDCTCEPKIIVAGPVDNLRVELNLFDHLVVAANNPGR
jgi:hypothetical protein